MSDAARQSTTLNRKWLLKMYIFLIAMVVLAIWGAFDAFWAYPARGRHDAEHMQVAYLERAKDKGRLLVEASVEDPAAELERLNALLPADGSIEQARRVWLTSLSRIENLDRLTDQNRAELARRAADPASPPAATHTMFPDPSARLDELNRSLNGKGQPSALNSFDIPLQYLLMILGVLGTVWMLLFLARNTRLRYQYDPLEKRLFLPGGRSIIPAEIAEVDKRDWHKYFVYFKPTDGSTELKLDLLRFTPLEEWVLEMEKLHPNYEPPPPEEEGPQEKPDDEGPTPPTGSGEDVPPVSGGRDSVTVRPTTIEEIEFKRKNSED